LKDGEVCIGFHKKDQAETSNFLWDPGVAMPVRILTASLPIGRQASVIE
jgi:hypothetical protein